MEFLVAHPGTRAGYSHWWKGERTACGAPLSPLDSEWVGEERAFKIVTCPKCLPVMRFWQSKKKGELECSSRT